MWWKQVREFPINICHNLDYNLTIWILYFNFTATCVLIPCGWCDSLMSSLFRDQSIITVWPSAISWSSGAPPTPRNKEYQAFVYPATPRHPLLQSRCDILTKLTRLIIIEVFVRRPVRPVMTDSAEHCPTHLSL